MKYMKYISFIGYGLLTVSIIIIIAFFATGDLKTLEFPLVDLLLNWAYFIIGAAAVLAIVLPLINIVKNPKAMIRSLIGMGIVAVVILLCYLMADDTPIVSPIGRIDDKTELIASDTGLFATYIALSVAVLSIAVGELSKVFRR